MAILASNGFYSRTKDSEFMPSGFRSILEVVVSAPFLVGFLMTTLILGSLMGSRLLPMPTANALFTHAPILNQTFHPLDAQHVGLQTQVHTLQSETDALLDESENAAQVSMLNLALAQNSQSPSFRADPFSIVAPRVSHHTLAKVSVPRDN